MAVFKTLQDLQAKVKQPAANSGERIDRFFTVKDGEQFKIRFRQELTEDGNNFTEEAGTFELTSVHASPLDFKLNAVCTKDDEDSGYQCWACEQVSKDKGWYAKQHLLINVAVWSSDTSKWEPRVLDQKLTAAHVGNDVIEYYGVYGTLRDREYRISRTGQGQKTNYTLIPMVEVDLTSDEATAIDALPVHDLSKVYRKFAYAEQEGFYTNSASGSTDSGGAAGWT